MKVLIAGDWHSDLHEEEVKRSLRRLGHDVAEFCWHGYFKPSSHILSRLTNLLSRAQNKYLAGPLVRKLNNDFVDKAIDCKPDIVFVYRGTHIWASALAAIRLALPSCIIVGYNNDDPFSPAQPKYYWRHFIASIPHYDLMLAYRTANLADFKRYGARRVELLRSWYVPDRNHPVELTESDLMKYSCDVVFIGHFEADQRQECLEEIVRQGFKLRLFGPTKYWAHPLSASVELHALAPVGMVWGADYNRALNGAKVALCFLSKLNRDTYTRRCFEIPASRTLMLSEYSDDLASLYNEGIEADFFRDKDELIRKIRMYLTDEGRRKSVAEAGYRKVTAAGHDIDSRIKMVLGWASEIRSAGEMV